MMPQKDLTSHLRANICHVKAAILIHLRLFTNVFQIDDHALETGVEDIYFLTGLHKRGYLVSLKGGGHNEATQNAITVSSS